MGNFVAMVTWGIFKILLYLWFYSQVVSNSGGAGGVMVIIVLSGHSY